MASVIASNNLINNNNFLMSYIAALENLWQSSILLEDEAQVLLKVSQKLAHMLEYTFITPEAKGQALLAVMKKITASPKHKFYLAVASTLLNTNDIQLLLDRGATVASSILDELVTSTLATKEALPLLEQYLKLLPGQALEAAIQQKIIKANLAISSINSCVAQSNYAALSLLLPYIKTPKYKKQLLAQWIIKGYAQIIATAVQINWLALKDKNRCLLQAAYAGQRDIVALLLAHGAGPNVADKEGDTPLRLAAIKGYQEVVALLLDSGAMVNPVATTAESPLMAAVENNHLELVKFLLARGALLNWQSSAGNNALLLAIAQKRHEIATLLIAQGAKDSANRNGLTALIAAAGVGDDVIVQQLLSRGSDSNAFDFKGNNALLRAAQRGNCSTVALLLANGANINHVNERGDGALMLAVMKNHYPTVKLLLEHGALDNPNKSAQTALQYASNHGYVDIVNLLQPIPVQAVASAGKGLKP